MIYDVDFYDSNKSIETLYVCIDLFFTSLNGVYMYNRTFYATINELYSSQ
jgi:hypothetical protein